ncbi:hypothetical protein Ae201684P_006390 [Aphanomyces euteiches]|nr:hypothetical protein Ae201684P_006390 [Aphanomyces euteiches]
MYQTRHNAALDEYLATVEPDDEAPQTPAKEEARETPKVILNWRRHILQRGLGAIVQAIRIAAPQHTKSDLLKLMDLEPDDEAPQTPAKEEAREAPKVILNWRRHILQRGLGAIVQAIRIAAPQHTKSDLLKLMALKYALQNTSLQLSDTKTPWSAQETLRSFVSKRSLRLCSFGSLLIAVAWAYLTVDLRPWQQQYIFIVAAIILLHVVFPLIVLVYWIKFSKRCRELSSQLERLQTLMIELETTCNQCLRAVKSAAVAQRGYLLDTWMPPISRLEANEASPSMQCLRLRQILHELYVKLPEENSQDPLISIPQMQAGSSAATLLLLSLSNQHKASMQAVQQRIDSLRNGIYDEVSLDQISHRVQWWQARLSHATGLVSKSMEVLPPPDSTEDATQPTQPQDSAVKKSLLQNMQILRNTLDTASAVIFASQQEVMAISNEATGVVQTDALKVAAARTRQLLDECESSWKRWHDMLHVEPVSRVAPPSTTVEENDESMTTELPTEASENSEAMTVSTFTEVFAGFSTGGGEGEDRAIIDADDVHTIATFNHVVHELQDVLDRRPQPQELVKGNDVEPDKGPVENTRPVKSTAAFNLPSVVSSELLGALGKMRQIEESFGEDDE